MRSPVGVMSVALVAAVVGIGGAAAGWFAPDPADPKVTLTEVERWVSSRYPAPEIDTAKLAELIAADAVVLLDVREPVEFEQSHIAGAIPVRPGAKPSSMAAAAGDRAKGRAVVFYCSVGARSGTATREAAKTFAAAGATGVYNLTGGLFRWSSEGRPLVNASGPAFTVHPYDAAWGKLLDRLPKPTR